jgi:hypothetical protein
MRRRSQALSHSHSFDEEELASSEGDLPFQAHFELQWSLQRTLPHHEPLAVVRDHVRSVAEEVSRKELITRASIVQDRINARLGAPYELAGSLLQLVWAKSTVTATPENITTARQRELRRSEARLRAEVQQHQIQRIEAFRSHVLADPGMALTYLFMEHPTEIGDESYRQVESLAQQVASYDPNKASVKIAHIIQDFVHDLTGDERRDSIDALKSWFRRYNKHEFAGRLPMDFGDSSKLST